MSLTLTLVVESIILGAIRRILELLGVTWDTDGDSNNNSSLNPTTGATKVLSSHVHALAHAHAHAPAHAHAHAQPVTAMSGESSIS